LQFSVSEVHELQERLKEIQSQMRDGKFVNSEGEVLPGQGVLQSLEHRCQIWTDLVLERFVGQSILRAGGLSPCCADHSSVRVK
jgi:hypothetical protein